MLQKPFLLACSGGVDSMVLWSLCRESGLDFEVAHCNFNLRGHDSKKDADFVAEMGVKWDHTVHIKQFNTVAYSTSHKQSLQESARVLRYKWFADLLRERNLTITITAHHADDQLETFLINLIRGTGLEGLTGIPAAAKGIRRPLLPFDREEILAYAHDTKTPWREDASNTEEKYLRNRLRQSVIPNLKKADSRVLGNFEKSLDFLKGSRALLGNHIAEVRDRVLEREGEVVRFPLKALEQLSPLDPYLYELFRPYGFTDWQALRRLMDGISGKEIRSATHRLLRDRTALLLRPIQAQSHEIYQIYPQVSPNPSDLPMILSEVAHMEQAGQNVLYVDRETLKEGLQLRKWQKGDYFYPLGMSGRQKIAKYFKDHKFNLFEKEEQWILCSGDAIVWLVGHRPDERFKVTGQTKQILRLEWRG